MDARILQAYVAMADQHELGVQRGDLPHGGVLPSTAVRLLIVEYVNPLLNVFKLSQER